MRRFRLTEGYAPIVVLAALFAAKLAVAAFVPLVGDEAYYVLWSRTLSAGYHDHPPMIALVIRLGTALWGETPLAVRSIAVLSGAATTAIVWLAAGLVASDRRAGPVAALSYAAGIFGFFGQTLATPDAPLTLFSAMALLFLLRALKRGAPGDWLLFGAAIGLAFEAKYSAVLLAAGAGVAILLVAPLRRRLATPWPWLAVGTALLVALPNILWNAEAGWETVRKQGGRVATGEGLGLGYLGELLASQLGMLTPLILLFAIVGCLPACRSAYRDAGTRATLLLTLAVPTGYFAVHALHSRVQGNWLGFLFPGYTILASIGLLVALEWKGRVWPRLAAAAIPVGLGLTGLAIIAVLFDPFAPLGSIDPVLRLTRGWRDLAAEVEARRREAGASYILTDNYQLNAELALLLPGVPVAQIDERERYRPLGEPDSAIRPGTALVVSRRADLPLDRIFARVEPQRPIIRQSGGRAIETYGSAVATGP